MMYEWTLTDYNPRLFKDLMTTNVTGPLFYGHICTDVTSLICKTRGSMTDPLVRLSVFNVMPAGMNTGTSSYDPSSSSVRITLLEGDANSGKGPTPNAPR